MESMPLDPRTPVIVGVAQVTDRINDPTTARTALELMVDACRSASLDAGRGAAAACVDMVAVVGGLWSHPDPGRRVADILGAKDATTLLTGLSGTSPQRLLDHLAGRISNGHVDSALMVGGEVFRSRRRARRLGVEVRQDRVVDMAPAIRYEGDLEMATPHEEKRGLVEPGIFYSIVETAIRHDHGETVEAHRIRIGRLWESFNAVAVTNPHAAKRISMDSEAITVPSANNRMVAAPYTKAMMANNNVDQASAILLTSVAQAEALGIHRDGWIFPLASTRADDPSSPSVRFYLHRSPAIRTAGNQALDLVGLDIDDIDHLDLYACFPSSVQVCASELGLDPATETRPLTANGGLTFAGAPHSNSVGQSLAALVNRLRSTPGIGLLYANGGYLGKHAFGIYSNTPPSNRYQSFNCAPAVANQTIRTPNPDYAGQAIVDGYTVRHDRDGLPVDALVAALTDTGARVWGKTAKHGTLQRLLAYDIVGSICELDKRGIVTL
jgi:acetyl-CoA C-acetyltransferase